MPAETFSQGFKLRVAFRHELLVRLREILGEYNDEAFRSQRTGQMLGLSDTIMEECFLLAGDIQMSVPKSGKEYYVTCDSHGERVPCYCVCKHVAEHKAKPVYHDPATPTNIGAICCQQCLDFPDILTADDAVLVCAPCALMNGFIPGTLQ